jgi:predicted transposase YbfD/YdcC
VLAVKPNQPTLYEQVREAIDEGLEQDSEQIDEHCTDETGHGRQEDRTYAVFPAPEGVDPEGLWQDPSAVGVTFSERTDPRGRTSLEGRYYILSRQLSAKEFADAVRGHWSIENQLHWQLDVSFREDESRVRTGHTAANLSVNRRLHWQLDVSFREDESRVRTGHTAANLSVNRRFALGLLKCENECQRGIETKRLKCALSEEYREKVLFNT